MVLNICLGEMNKYFLLTMVAILGTLIYLSCSSLKSKKNYPEDLNISFGNGGGFTGIWKGWTVDSVGNVYSWMGKVQEENARRIGFTDNKVMETLWKEIKEGNLMNIKYQEPGNISKYIKIKANGKINTILWNPYSNGEIIDKLNSVDSILFEKIKPENQR